MCAVISETRQTSLTLFTVIVSHQVLTVKCLWSCATKPRPRHQTPSPDINQTCTFRLHICHFIHWNAPTNNVLIRIELVYSLCLELQATWNFFLYWLIRTFTRRNACRNEQETPCATDNRQDHGQDVYATGNSHAHAQWKLSNVVLRVLTGQNGEDQLSCVRVYLKSCAIRRHRSHKTACACHFRFPNDVTDSS